ncbi:gamma-interferon-inducible lysosomal thiol reductase [Drosophila pseudoobscura]|uniref:Gamma-interferon-inducible lysosomal thiol reductase n=1 Tax=Drosophila pseudoobscura pseudoobscura TaxID=46245 RepID=A0A6I8W0B8_DROPS|nr:gamma-interferon-inducible lysosomal thiol reductase [Drosophila pseudoobscura]XP_033236205.1 gamma-interferon-inducible lysosomal thiol reductase [Drosophila pseudoobscura]
MVPTRKRIVIIICVVVILGCLLRILLFNSPLPTLSDQENYQRTIGAPVLVKVFYEALCPDSKYFLTKQLLPAYEAAAPIMEVLLVPYGKATTSENDGKLSFDCQHGPTECQANIYHACASEAIEDPLVRLQVVSCMIRDNRSPQEAMRKCAKQHVDLVQKCYDSKQGSELLKQNGEATHSLRPQVTFIPTITIDGYQGRQASILKNLLFEVCKAAGDTDQAKQICKNTV